MSDRWYGQQQGKFGYKAASAASKPNAKGRRLKSDIVTEVCEALGVSLPSLAKMTNPDLEILLEKLCTKNERQKA